jgi:hypothetical protein
MSLLPYVTESELETLRHLNLSVELVCKAFRRQRMIDSKWDAWWYARHYVTQQRDMLRERVAEACAPWFDGSAFEVEQQPLGLANAA